MMNIETLVSEILSTMHARVELQANSPKEAEFQKIHHATWRTHRALWAELKQRSAEYLLENKNEPEALKVLLDAMNMQDKRESGEFHIASDTAVALWNKAIQAGDAFLADLAVQTTGPRDAGAYFKQRASTLGDLMRRKGSPFGHSQMLQLMAKAEGYNSFQAMQATLAKAPSVPGFCPHCGAAVTLRPRGSVYCEQGEYIGSSYEAEGQADHFECSRCSGQFTNWSSDVLPKDEDAASSESVADDELDSPSYDVNVYAHAKMYAKSDSENVGTFGSLNEAMDAAKKAIETTQCFAVVILDNNADNDEVAVLYK